MKHLIELNPRQEVSLEILAESIGVDGIEQLIQAIAQARIEDASFIEGGPCTWWSMELHGVTKRKRGE